MSFESYYGGRQGASFIIVKRFDGIDIPEKSKNKIAYYAVNEDKIIKYPFIERTDQNYGEYDWVLVKLDGSTVNVILEDGTESTQVVAIAYQEGMRQCFEQGGDSVDIVNYGEYVIIDTPSKDNPENGKVFRRGMNFDYNATTNPLAGAEYIGQIIGPKGSTAEIDIVSYKTAIDYDPHQEREYTVAVDNQGLVPGVDVDRTEYADSIHYAWTTIRDDAGNVSNYQVGFKFPYLVPEISGSKRSPYYTQEDYNLGRISDINLIGTPIQYEDDFDLFIDNGENTADRIPDHGDTGHPFYRKWKINIPQGIKGDTLSEMKIYPTIVTQGSEVYTEAGSDGALSGNSIVLDEDVQIIVDSYWDTFEKGYVTIKVNNATYYAYLVDTAELHYGYLLTWYDEHEDGRDHKWIDIGQYRTIDHIHLDENGWVTVYYTCDNPDKLEEALRWVWLDTDPENARGVQLDADGTVTIWYNTLDEDGEHEYQRYENIFDWIENTSLDRNGHFKVLYNNNSLYDANNPYEYDPTEPENWSSGWISAQNKASWETDLTWPTQITLTEAGVLKFLYNNNLLQDIYPTDPADGVVDRTEGSYSFVMPWITEVKLFQNGVFNFRFNNDRLYDENDPDWDPADHTIYRPQITWVSNVEIADDGTVTFIFCDDTVGNPHRYEAPYKIKYLTNVSINTEASAGSGEGTGNQKVHLTWNTIDSITGEQEEEDIGNPLNYIIESTISIPNISYPTVPYWHLLVYYSDPALREQFEDKWVTYPSEKYPGIVRTDWVDLGPVKGENTGIHVLKNITDMDELKDAGGSWIPPERLPGADGVTILNPDAAGWSCTLQEPNTDVTIYLFYDYEAKKWYKGTSVDPSAIDPSYVITKSIPNDYQEPIMGDADNLKPNGFWFAVETGIAIK